MRLCRLMYGRNKIEKKVREPKKQGTKLYSLSPHLFLLMLFRSQDAYVAGFITLVAVAVVGLDVFGATQIFSCSVEPQEPLVTEDVTGSEELEDSLEANLVQMEKDGYTLVE